MTKTNPNLYHLPSEKLKIWVLAPSIESNDENIAYYYDFSQSIAEYTKCFGEMEIEWVWQPITTLDYADIIAKIAAEKEAGIYLPIVFNICDGDEVNDTPGISVVKLLQQTDLIFTGADEYFYDITTSKIPMKIAFEKAGVPTAPWEAIKDTEQHLNGIFKRLGTPLIVKPAVSGGSMGLGIKNIVSNEADLKSLVIKMFEGYRGWNLTSDGLVAESFINGNEYTTLIVGAYDKPEFAIIYNPVQRVFHPSLPDEEKILSFDRLWEIYEDEEPMPDEANFYEYEAPDAGIIDEIKKLSWDAFKATKGKGYTRIDLRQDKLTRKLYVLEINAQCGLSEDEDYTSIGAILRLSGKTFTELIKEIINTAFLTSATKAQKRKSIKLVNINYRLPFRKTGDSA